MDAIKWDGIVVPDGEVICEGFDSECAVLLKTAFVIYASSLPTQFSPGIASRHPHVGPNEVLPLAEVERQALLLALEASGDNVTRAVHALGIHRATLHRKLKKYNLDRD